jgi:hypothetical protein
VLRDADASIDAPGVAIFPWDLGTPRWRGKGRSVVRETGADSFCVIFHGTFVGKVGWQSLAKVSHYCVLDCQD